MRFKDYVSAKERLSFPAGKIANALFGLASGLVVSAIILFAVGGVR
jgi:tetrahydromethanopterin S-methyltransferase subunit B